MRPIRNLRGLLTACTALISAPVLGQQATPPPATPSGVRSDLEDAFRSPPDGARPRVWWHWMNGNVTKDGIRKDMEWMKRIGIGGLTAFDANLTTPKIVDKRLIYMHPDWKDAFKYAVGLADRLGLELAIASSPGWSETGGPWVKPEDGLKKLVWSETSITGGRPFAGRIAMPPKTTGPFLTMPQRDPLAELSGTGHSSLPTLYRDVAVLAYPVPDRIADAASPVSVMAGRTTLDAAALLDDDLDTITEVRRPASGPTIVVYRYAKPHTVRSATLFVPGGKFLFWGPSIASQLEASDDGWTWRKIADVPAAEVPTTVSFAPVTARQFRLVITAIEPEAPNIGRPAPGTDTRVDDTVPVSPNRTKYHIAEFKLLSDAKVSRFETKAGYALVPEYYALDTAGPDLAGVDPARIINLTDRLQTDGTLRWTPPKGNWRVLRLGWSLLGTVNHPATAEATGLEVDKFDGAAVRRYLETYLGMYRDTVGADMIGVRGIRAILTDSIEVGAANWTPDMIARFKSLRGYDPTPYLPALTGVVVGSVRDSDRFLYDYRRTLADLMSSEHYGTLADFAHANKLKVYGEALENVRPSLGDDMAMRSHADIPMAALWAYPRNGAPSPVFLADMKGAASVAHIYGQNLVAAESMTSYMSPWAYAPKDLRRIIDLEFASGVNLPVIHTSVHQPVDDKQPGLSLSIFGQYFNRHETWAEMARPWIDYIARSALMLQQGRNFADVAYFYGEEAPLTALSRSRPPVDLPKNYAFDYANADVLMHRLSVDNGDVVAATGARYRVLYLGGTSEKITLPALRKIAQLAGEGATVVGQAPRSSPSLKDDKIEFAALVARLWSGAATTKVGRGRVIKSRNVEAALAQIGVQPDFAYAKPVSDSNILFVHRLMPDGNVYFLNNRVDRSEHIEAKFRVSGKVPEIWHAETGTTEPVSYRSENGITTVPLDFLPEQSLFVVFRKPADRTQENVLAPVMRLTGQIAGPWAVALQEGRGAPRSITLPRLETLSNNAVAGVRYFSGISTYRSNFTSPPGYRPGQPLVIDLGDAGDIAEVAINGKTLGTVWQAPWRIDIGEAVKSGRNSLEVRVANVWVNRLIGDVQPNSVKVAYTTLSTYLPDAPLRPSGLLGPVTLLVPQVNKPCPPSQRPD